MWTLWNSGESLGGQQTGANEVFEVDVNRVAGKRRDTGVWGKTLVDRIDGKDLPRFLSGTMEKRGKTFCSTSEVAAERIARQRGKRHKHAADALLESHWVKVNDFRGSEYRFSLIVPQLSRECTWRVHDLQSRIALCSVDLQSYGCEGVNRF